MVEHLAIVGATGAVGGEFLAILEQRAFSFKKIKLLASARSAGKMIRFAGRDHVVEELTEDSFEGVDLALFSAGAGTSKRFAPAATEAGAVVVDNSSAYRMDPGTPLVVPEVNPGDIARHNGVIANPNCSTIIMNVPVWPLHSENPVRRIVVSTYQSASGAGARGMAELESQTRELIDGGSANPEAFPHQIAFNLFSHDSEIGEDGYNTEEVKMIRETRKIFHDDSIAISATCVRVPVYRAHSESINLTFERPFAPHEAREILSSAPGVRIVDDRESNRFPMPIEASGQDDILVGRIRQDASQSDGRGLELFVAGDQLLKGAALNAVQIAESLLESGRVPA
jgi:aspartate-semialdehyde dehydrogenase